MKCDKCGCTFHDEGSSCEWVAGNKIASDTQTYTHIRGEVSETTTTYTNFLPITTKICQECYDKTAKVEFEKAEEEINRQFKSGRTFFGPILFLGGLLLLSLLFWIGYSSGDGFAILYRGENNCGVLILSALAVILLVKGFNQLFGKKDIPKLNEENVAYKSQYEIARKKANLSGRDAFWSKEYFDENLKPRENSVSESSNKSTTDVERGERQSQSEPAKKKTYRTYRLKITDVSDRVAAMKELRSVLTITPAEAKQIIDNLPHLLVESTKSYDVTGWEDKLKSCTLEVEKEEFNINETEFEISLEDSPEPEYEETTTEEIEIKESDWIAYYGFFRDRDENADRFFETLLDWSKDNPPPATFILCRFDTDGANYVHYVGCIANRADCSKLSLWVGNDFYRYQQETGTPSEFAKNSGTAPLPQLMTEEMVVDMIDESRFEIIRSIY